MDDTLTQALETYSTDGRQATATTTQHGYIRLTLTGPTGRTKTHTFKDTSFAAWFLTTETDTDAQEARQWTI